LTWSTRLAYGTGHILNDLCASMWFTYLLLFFEKVLSFDTLYSGVVLTTGQIADGIATLGVGYFSDKNINLWLCAKYGKRKSWHLIGTLCVVVSFPFIFLGCIGCSNASFITKMFYFITFVVVFQFGWAATQISHLALIPELTPSQDERTGLTAIRYSATVVSNITVYLLAWAFLGSATKSVGPDDMRLFAYLMVACVSIGIVATIIFHIQVSKPQPMNEGYEAEQGSLTLQVDPMSVLDWIKEPQTYQVSMVYMTTRIFVNLTQTYVPLYLQVTLQLPSSYVATIPLIMFLVGFVTSTVMKYLNRKIGRKATFLLGCSLGFASCLWILFGCKNDNMFVQYEVFGVAALIGAGGSTMLVTSLSVTAELIGQNCESAAFIYGAMSLTDKFANGLVVIAVQSLVPGFPEECNHCDGCSPFYSQVLFYVCGGAALLGILSMLSLVPFTIGRRFSKKEATSNAESFSLKAKLSAMQ